eukprot:768737-Hanusia_phi.AAC.11
MWRGFTRLRWAQLGLHVPAHPETRRLEASGVLVTPVQELDDVAALDDVVLPQESARAHILALLFQVPEKLPAAPPMADVLVASQLGMR